MTSDEFSRLLMQIESDAPGGWDDMYRGLADLLKPEIRAILSVRGRRGRIDTTDVFHRVLDRLLRRVKTSPEIRDRILAMAGRIALDVVIETVRYESRKIRGGGSTPVDVDAIAEPPATDASPEDRVLQLERLETLSRGIQLLEESHPRAARVIVLKNFDEKTWDEVSAETGLSVEQARGLERLGKARIKQFLAGWDDDGQ